MSAMTASSSKPSIHRQPHTIPLPFSPEKSATHHGSHKRRKAGKEREGNPPRRVRSGSDAEWDHTRAGTKPWPWTSLTESSASTHPPVFSRDGRYFFAIVGSSIKIYSCSTGQIVSTLSGSSAGSGHANQSDTITSAILNPNNAFQLITGSLNGHIKVWDFLDAKLLQTIIIDHPIFHVCAHEKCPDYVFVAATKSSKMKNSNGHEKEANGIVLRVSLKPRNAPMGSKSQTSSDITAVGKTRAIVGLAFSSSGSWLVAIAGHKAYVASTKSLKSGFTKYVSPEALTCLALHPSEDYFATGDDKGNIRLWYCLNEQVGSGSVGVEKRAQTTTLHWHAHTVSCLTFTPNGAYLLSGGEEAVLVIWQLHTGKKEFVPRVGAPISTIAIARGVENEEYLLGLADSTFTFVSAATLKISRSYSGIKLDPEVPSSGLPLSFPTPLAIHSATSTLILPSSHPSSLQTYAPSTSTLVGELEVSPSNKVSRRDEVAAESSRVERAVISSSGEWMATVDGRGGDESFRGEIYLKIWWWNSKTRLWILNTRIDRPHGLQRVTSILFSPEIKDRLALRLVTTGDDLNIKIWRLRIVARHGEDVEESWVTRSSFNFRRERPTGASWSPDGSLLCISLGPYVVLYDADSTILRQILTSPDCRDVCQVQFVGRSGRYLASVSMWGVVLWDISAQSVRWHYKSLWPINNILSHPRDNSFALLHCPSISPISGHHTTPITIFTPSSSIPLRKHTVPFTCLNLVWYPTPSMPQSNAYSLVGITNKYSVVLFGDEVIAPTDEGASPKAIIGGAALDQRKSLFQDVFGASAFVDASNVNSSVSVASTGGGVNTTLPHGNNVERLLDAPSYLLPPMELLFESLISSFILPRHREQDNAPGSEGKDHRDEDFEMNSEDDAVTIGLQRERSVSQEEVELFIDLFTRVKVSSAHHARASSSEPNGKINYANSVTTPSSNMSKTTNGFKSPTPVQLVANDVRSSPSIVAPKQTKKRRRPSERS